MNLKFAHLVAIQFGIFVGVVSCLLFFRFEPPKPRTATEIQELATQLAAAVKAAPEPEDQRAEPEQDQLAPGQLAPAVPNEYSPEAVEQYRSLAAKLYYEQIAPRRHASSRLANSSIAAVAPSDAEVAQEPAVVHTDDPAPQTVAYVEPTQVIVYPQAAQFVVFSNRRRFANRCRPAPHPGALASNPHRPPDRGRNHLSGSPGSHPPRSIGVVHRRNTGVPSCPPSQRFKPQGKR